MLWLRKAISPAVGRGEATIHQNFFQPNILNSTWNRKNMKLSNMKKKLLNFKISLFESMNGSYSYLFRLPVFKVQMKWKFKGLVEIIHKI